MAYRKDKVYIFSTITTEAGHRLMLHIVLLFINYDMFQSDNQEVFLVHCI